MKNLIIKWGPLSVRKGDGMYFVCIESKEVFSNPDFDRVYNKWWEVCCELFETT